MTCLARASKPSFICNFLFLITFLLSGPLEVGGGRDFLGVVSGGLSISGKPEKSEVEVFADEEDAGDGAGVLVGLENDTKVSSLEEDEDMATAVDAEVS